MPETESKPQRLLRVVLPKPMAAKKGEEPPLPYSGLHPIGIRFMGGIGQTDDEPKAIACASQIPGAQVRDAQTGKLVWPLVNVKK